MNWKQESYVQALNFATDAHHGQLVTGTQRPYVTHLTKVAMEVTAALVHAPKANGELAVICALLHDSIEDTQATYVQIDAHFGSEVAQGVLALTKNKTLAKEEQMNDSLRRILQQPAEIAMVKLADRITNLAPPPDQWSREKRAAYQVEAQLIHDRLGESSPYLAQRLRDKITAYSTWIF